MGPIGQASEDEGALSQRHCKVFDAGKEVRIGRAGCIVSSFLVGDPGFNAEETSAIVNRLLTDGLPALLDKVGLIAEMVVLS